MGLVSFVSNLQLLIHIRKTRVSPVRVLRTDLDIKIYRHPSRPFSTPPSCRFLCLVLDCSILPIPIITELLHQGSPSICKIIVRIQRMGLRY